MDTSSFSAVGDQLEGFLAKQFTPPDGTRAVLGFFGSGLAVEPASFISDDGKFNPARVNTWLNISLDVVNAVADSRVGSPVMPATQLMQAICSSATSTAPTGSDTALVLGRIKSQVMEDLGGAVVIQTAPLNWYDPAEVAQWPKYGMKIGSGSPPAPPSGVKIPIDRPPLWTWRTVAQTRPETFIAVHPPVPLVQTKAPHPMLMATATLKPAMNVSAMHAVAPHLAVANTVLPLKVLPIKETTVQTVHLAASSMAFNAAVNTAANQASVQPVDASSMSVDLSYALVNLSRSPWWNDLLLGMNNWYVPGQHRNSWVGASTSTQCFGLPVALILTANVQIKAAWSQGDRAAAAGSSHVGPWSLAGAQIPAADSSGQATLQIPSMQAIGCIYRVLPALPPLDDPALAASPAAGAS